MSRERRLARKLGPYGVSVGMGQPFNPPVDPRMQAAMEQDWKRERLAEELLKILTEETASTDPDLKSRMAEAAEAALAAAEAVYPELPEKGEA